MHGELCQYRFASKEHVLASIALTWSSRNFDCGDFGDRIRVTSKIDKDIVLIAEAVSAMTVFNKRVSF
jgi:hypothetical protein